MYGYDDEDNGDYEDDYDYGDGRLDFADPGGESALRAATPTNPPQPALPDVRRKEPADPEGPRPGVSV